jgi:hypothetical protein
VVSVVKSNVLTITVKEAEKLVIRQIKIRIDNLPVSSDAGISFTLNSLGKIGGTIIPITQDFVEWLIDAKSLWLPGTYTFEVFAQGLPFAGRILHYVIEIQVMSMATLNIWWEKVAEGSIDPSVPFSKTVTFPYPAFIGFKLSINAAEVTGRAVGRVLVYIDDGAAGDCPLTQYVDVGVHKIYVLPTYELAVFQYWSDGVKDNPRYIDVRGDVSLTAYFKVEM